MGKQQTDKRIDEMIEDLIYIRLFDNELAHLGKKKFIKIFFLLKMIEKYGNPSMSTVGKILHVPKSQMTSKSDELTKAGFIERLHDEKDRRIIRIVLTHEGENFIKNYQKTVDESMNQLLSKLSFEEIEELKKSLETIKNVILKIQESENLNVKKE